MLQRLRLQNYRAFENLDISLTKINLFFGPNNSGKSSILSAINLLAQTIETEDWKNPLLLNGKYEDLGTYKDIVYQNNLKNDISIGLDFVQYEEMKSYDFKYSYRPQRKEITLSNVKITNSKNELEFESKYSDSVEKPIVVHLFKPLNKGEKTKLSNSTHLIHFIPFGFRNFETLDTKASDKLDMSSINLIEYLKKLEFIGPFRASPKRTYLFSGESPTSIGKHGEKAIDIIASDYMRRGKKKKGIVDNVSKWLNLCEIASELDLKVLTDRHFELRLSNVKSKEKENLADVGYGCSQILPILISGTTLPKESALLIQQPELHLHPRAQAGLGTFFNDLSKNNTQLFIETHSEHLLLRLQCHIASGELDSKDVSVYYVYVNDVGKKDAIHLPLNNKGLFEKEWPEGFFPERLNEAKNVAKASLHKKGE